MSIRPIYVKGISGSNVDYMRFYHFLEGCADPHSWPSRIDYDSPNLRIRDEFSNDWLSASSNRKAFENLFGKFREAVIVVSYKEPGLPSKKQLIHSLKKYKKKVIVKPGLAYDY
jgi:adenine-specific DNA-methyltransferase